MDGMNEIFGMSEEEYIEEIKRLLKEIYEIINGSDSKIEASKKLIKWIDEGDRELKAVALIDHISVLNAGITELKGIIDKMKMMTDLAAVAAEKELNDMNDVLGGK